MSWLYRARCQPRNSASPAVLINSRFSPQPRKIRRRNPARFAGESSNIISRIPTKVSKYGVFREACGEALADNPSHAQVVDAWIADGFSAEHIAAVLKVRSAGKPAGSIVSWRYFDKAVKEAPPLPASAQASAPAQPKAPAASQARGFQGATLQASEPRPQATNRDPWSQAAKQQARALLKGDIGRRAATEGWAITLYDFCREHGRLPADGGELNSVHAAGMEFARKIADDRSPLAKAALRRMESLTALANDQAARMAACPNVVQLRPRSSTPSTRAWH